MSYIKNMIMDIVEFHNKGFTNMEISSMLSVPVSIIEDVVNHYA